MATAAQVLKSALKRIMAQGSDVDLEPDEYSDAIFSMNNFMFSLDAEGVALGYTEVSNLGDEVTIPVGALRGLIANIAIEISPDYGGIVSQSLAITARDGLKIMEKLGGQTSLISMPSTLPVGSGNQGCYGGTDTFYPDLEETILAETTGSIALETDTP